MNHITHCTINESVCRNTEFRSLGDAAPSFTSGRNHLFVDISEASGVPSRFANVSRTHYKLEPHFTYLNATHETLRNSTCTPWKLCEFKTHNYTASQSESMSIIGPTVSARLSLPSYGASNCMSEYSSGRQAVMPSGDCGRMVP